MLKLKNKNQNCFDWIYEVVKNVPKGKVATYSEISDELKSQNLKLKARITPRVVGWALHTNKNPRVPCHRVVNREGRLALNFASNGAKEQRIRLLSEGVKFKDNMHVDLTHCLWQPKP
jgi:methylated-DNA-protein-cysteine methyltransferase-like protein